MLRRLILIPALFLASCGLDNSGPPNIVLLVVDTLRADHLSGYGYERETSPFLDSLIERGSAFEAVAASSWSPSSHSSIMTGTYGFRHRVEDWGHRIQGDLILLPSLLQEAGYATGTFATHINLLGTNEQIQYQGRTVDPVPAGVARIDEGLDVKKVLPPGSEDLVLALGAEWAAAQDRPWFLWSVLFTVHAPYDKYPPEWDDTLFTDMPEGGERRHPFKQSRFDGTGGIPGSVRLGDADTEGFYINRYDRSVRAVDDQIRRFWEALEASGDADNTVLIVTSDHGEGLGDHGNFAHEIELYDYLVRVPLIVAGPGVARQGHRSTEQIRLVDLFPTLSHMGGARRVGGLDGVDLHDTIFLGAPVGGSEWAYASYTARTRRRFMLRGRGHKLIHDAVGRSWQFYDLASDPAEERDLTHGGSLSADDRSLLEEMRRGLLAMEALHAAGGDPSSPELTEAQRAMLRDFGYLDDE